jgi:vancomycin permeability regulator SanA
MAAKQLVWLALEGLALVAGLIALPNLWVAHAAGARVYADSSSSPARSIAIVPGADVHKGRPTRSLTQRLETALSLYRAGQVKTILVSGNNSPASPEVSVMRGWLQERGVPASDVLSDERGSRTRNTMLDAVAQFGVGDAIVCTQALYVDRAVFLAREAGIDAVGIGVPSAVSGSWRNVGRETLKTALAFYESYLRERPVAGASRTEQVAVALR